MGDRAWACGLYFISRARTQTFLLPFIQLEQRALSFLAITGLLWVPTCMYLIEERSFRGRFLDFFWLTGIDVGGRIISALKDPQSVKPYFSGTSCFPKDQWAGSLSWGPSPWAQRGQSAGGKQAEWHIDLLIYIITTVHPDKWAPRVWANHLGE